jgi:hypothetical protein
MHKSAKSGDFAELLPFRRAFSINNKQLMLFEVSGLRSTMLQVSDLPEENSINKSPSNIPFNF